MAAAKNAAPAPRKITSHIGASYFRKGDLFLCAYAFDEAHAGGTYRKHIGRPLVVAFPIRRWLDNASE